MRLAVLSAPDSWYFRDLQRAAEGKHALTAVPFSHLHADTSESVVRFVSSEFDFADCDAALVRTMPPGSLEQVVFRMDVLGQLEATGKLVLNPPRSLAIAVDKYLALAKLQAAGLVVPRTVTCQTWGQGMEAFAQLGGDVVVKPLFGSEGRGLMRIHDEALAWRTFKALEQLGAVLYIQEFIEHEGVDIRVLLIGDDVFGMRRRNAGDWRTNVARGATTEAVKLSDGLVEVAKRAADAVGAPLAGVDILPARNGKHYVLEVNAVPGWKAIARTLDVDIASNVLSYCELRL